MTFRTNTNLFLWLLSGRSSGFASPALNTNIGYPLHAVPKEVEAARELLCLGDTRSDFYVFGALGALYASLPSTRDLPSETATAFTPELFTLQEPVVIGALLRPPDGQSWPSIQNVAQGRMSPIVFDIRFQDGQTSVVTDQGTSLILDHEHHGGLLSVPGLSQFGIRALFKVSSWTVGSYFQISAPLTRYPYAVMAEAIRQRGDLLTFMNSEGLLESFSSPVSAVQQVGALAAAIVRRMARETEALYGSFSVELPSVPPSIPPDAILFDGDVLLFDGVPIIFT
jgi:hypothetical protein